MRWNIIKRYASGGAFLKRLGPACLTFLFEADPHKKRRMQYKVPSGIKQDGPAT